MSQHKYMTDAEYEAEYGPVQLPYLTSGESSSECLDSGLVCSIDPRTGKCTECGKPEDL
ncbi:hypothetical protein MUG78_16770 [Gordonia alkaliphila]|uniref:hypothetical protein n=1 Tax=Gordonia alkaliphila TaxID=1053547 RepID=UPI001FF33CD1|nr:hypothetical protein [Gordonia alkaliphila]MCK0441054.1 hypothetical protein [Gordonia alkaliphila]